MTDPSDDPTLHGAAAEMARRGNAPGVQLARAAVLGAMFGEATEATFGRYTPRRRLGTGASGAVYLARDTALQRDVALKVLVTQTHEPLSPAASRRYLREARAIARLSHPNVVEIYDVGVERGMPYLAMELVDGGSLDAWLQQPERDTAAIVDAFVQAAEGLCAAHGAGLVHRDFKPANVLVGRDGRVRVADFGLAGFFTPTEAGAPPSELEVPTDGETLAATRTGAVVGTPAFMAPEQHRGEAADARADQYALCASLYFALHGVRPFDADSIAALYYAKVHVRLQRPVAERAVPSAVTAAIRRGLSPDPDDRWPSIAALSTALRGGRARRRRHVAAVGLLVVAAAVGAFALPRSAADCTEAAAELDDVWSEGPRARLQTHLQSLGADALWARARTRFDAFADTWRDRRRSVCEATAADPLAAAGLDAQMQCLRLARARLASSYDLLLRVDAAGIGDASELVAALHDPGCEASTLRADAAPRPDDPRLAAAVDELRERRTRLAPGFDAAGLAPDDPTVAALFDEAIALDDGPLAAEMYTMRARMRMRQGDSEGARADYATAYEVASEHGYDRLVFDAAIEMYRLVGGTLGTDESAQRWAEYARAAAARAGDPPAWMARYEDSLGVVARVQGDAPEAVAHGRLAVAAYERLDPPDPRLTAAAMSNLATALRSDGAANDALEVSAEAVAILEDLLGPDHRLVYGTRYGYAMALDDVDRREEADAQLRRALDSARRGLPAEHPWLAAMENAAGVSARRRLDFVTAREHFERALAATEGSSGRERAELVSGISASLGEVLWELGEPDRAVELLREGLAAGEEGLDPGDPRLLLARWRLGNGLQRTDRLDEAQRVLERCLADAERDDAPDVVALAAFDLGRIVWATDPERASRLVARARERWTQEGPLWDGRPFPHSAAAHLATIDAWRAEHPSAADG